LVVPKEGEPLGIWWERDWARIAQEGWLGKNLSWGSGQSLVEVIVKALKEMGADRGRVAFEFKAAGGRVAMGILHAFEYLDLKEKLPGLAMTDGCPLLDEVMLIKEKEEVVLMRQAAAIADSGFLAVENMIRPGLTENQVAGVAEGAMRSLGSEWNWSLSGGTEVGSGPRTAYPGGLTQPATDKIIQAGENIILDLHPMYRLYMADAAYNLILGRPSSEQARLAGVWEEAVAALLGETRPGVKISQAAKAAHQVFIKNDLGDHCLSSFGHGLGVDSRVTPSVGLQNDSCFQENMAFAAGVHLYVPGIGGMRLELPTLVTGRGAEPLCKYALKVHSVG
jgi:Xaa-Pro aminopeptidase